MGNAASRKEEQENLPPQIVTTYSEDLDRSGGEGDDRMETNEGDTPVLLKSRAHIMALVDPRSPTQEISRTPIALDDQKPTRRESLLNPKLAKLKENSTPNTPLAPFFDPRSPTEDIDRTPIRY
ncbi:unnamed protein product [Allacma fusca]|uniref:Uncharacterized protein n=1 Tax=Allacma fusca TaxID=39272 RepID=A0A8J2PJ35_9HEXA|nr:unnamed protein product [Allacma fusca]